MQFQVPQFIDIQPKIVGPLTLRQFLYIAGAAVPLFLLFFVLAFWLWVLIAVFLVAIAAALAFGKMNGQPLARVTRAAFRYFWEPRFYLWKRVEDKPKLPTLPRLPREEKPRPSIKELAFKIITTTRPIEKRERPSKFFSPVKKRADAFEVIRKTTGERESAKRVDFR